MDPKTDPGGGTGHRTPDIVYKGRTSTIYHNHLSAIGEEVVNPLEDLLRDPEGEEVTKLGEMMAQYKEDCDMKEVILRLNRIEGAIQKFKSDDGMHTFYSQESGNKVVCEMKCSVISVGEIDTVKQQFEAVIFLSFKWRKTKVDDPEKGKYWNPRVDFPNAVVIEEKCRKNDIQLRGTEAYVYLFIKIKGTFKTAMRLKNFPFDFQELTIEVSSSWSTEKMSFQRRTNKDTKIVDNISINAFTGKHEWNLQEHIITESEPPNSTETTCNKQDFQESTLEKHYTTKKTRGYPKYCIKLHAQRRPLYYIWNVALPTFCILALSFTSFVIEADVPSERLSVTVTMLLTAVAFKSVVSSMLPRISYLTFLDEYVLCSFILQCLMVAQNAVAAVCAKQNKCQHLDVWSKIALASMAVVVNIAFIVWGAILYIKGKHYLGSKTKEYKNNKAPDYTAGSSAVQYPSRSVTETYLPPASTKGKEEETLLA